MIFDVPRITTSLRDSITPVNSSVIYNTDNNRYEYYNGTSWKPFGEGGVISFNTRTGIVTLLDSDIAELGDFTVSGTLTINNDIIFGSETLKIMTSSVDPNVSGVSANTGSIILKDDGSIWQKLDSNDTDWSRVQTDIFTGEPTGFPVDANGQVDRTSSVISFDNASLTFSIAPVSTSYTVLIKGRQYRKTTTETISITDVEGLHYFYFNSSGQLTTGTSLTSSTFLNNALIAIIYWDSTNDKIILFGDERHGCTMDSHTHARIHFETGAVYVSGMALNNFTADGDGSSEAHLTFSTSNGELRDEDILHSLTSKSTSNPIPIFYREGIVWRSITPSAVSGTYARAIGSIGTPGQIAYNQLSGGSWSRVNLNNNSFCCYHLIGTNDVNNPYILIMGTSEYSTNPTSQTGAINEIGTLSGLPFVEMVFVGTVLFKCVTSVSNSLKAKIVSTNGGTYIDWRFQLSLNPTTANTNNHNVLGGIYGSIPYYHSDQPISTIDDVTFKSLTATDNISLSNQIIYTNTGNLTSSTINTNYSIIKFNPNTTTTIHGIDNPSDGKIIILQNISSSIDITINHQSTTETTTGNRIITVLGTNVILRRGTSAMLIYSSSDSRWRFISSGSHNDLSGINGGDSTINQYFHSNQQINTSSSVVFADVQASNSLSVFALYNYTSLSGDVTSSTLVPSGSSFSIVTSSPTTIHGIGWGVGANFQGKILIIRNNSASTNIIIANQSSTETTATRRIITGTGSNYTLVPDASIILFYDGSTTRWKIIGQNRHNIFSDIQGGDGTNYYHSNQPINTTDNVIFNNLSINELTASGTSNLTNVVISGDLTVNGTTTTVNSTITVLEDPIIELGKTSPVLDDNKDRGISFNYHDGVSAKVGYFGYQDSTGNFIFIPDASIVNEIVSGTKGTIDANIDWTNINNIPDYLLKTGGVISGNLGVTGSTTLSDLTVTGTSILNETRFDVEINNSVSGSIDDVNINSKSTIIFSPLGPLTITGFDSGVSANGKILYIINKGSADITLVNDSVLSQSQNRIITGTGTDFTIKAGAGTVLQFYDGWRLLGGAAGGGSSSSTNEEIVSINSGSSININSNGSIFETYEDGHYDFMSIDDPTLSFELFIKNGSPPDATIITSSNLVFDSDESGYLCAFISGNNLVLKNNLGYSISLKVFFVGVS
jgi:hypothetical protein